MQLMTGSLKTPKNNTLLFPKLPILVAENFDKSYMKGFY